MDETVSATLVYSRGRIASFNSSFKVNLPNEAFIVGTKGIIKVGKCCNTLTATASH